SQRQLRFVGAAAACAASARDAAALRRMGCERPTHPRYVARAAVNDELYGAARPIRAGEIDAFLDVDAVALGAERPHPLVRPGEHGSAVEHAPDGTSLDEAA